MRYVCPQVVSSRLSGLGSAGIALPPGYALLAGSAGLLGHLAGEMRMHAGWPFNYRDTDAYRKANDRTRKLLDEAVRSISPQSA